jgi:hypothetical protein
VLFDSVCVLNSGTDRDVRMRILYSENAPNLTLILAEIPNLVQRERAAEQVRIYHWSFNTMVRTVRMQSEPYYYSTVRTN